MSKQFLVPISIVVIAMFLSPTMGCKVVRSFQPKIQQGGRVEALAVDPGNNDKVMLASQTGGLFKSTNGGVNWTWINTPLFRFSDVQYAPWNSNLVVASALRDWSWNSKGGVWVSTNGGSAFTKATQADGCTDCIHIRDGLCVEMDTWRSQIYVGTDTGIYIGDNAGVNWRFTSPKTSGNRAVFSILSADETSVIAMCNDGLYESPDGERNWTKIYNKPNNVNFIGRHNNLARSPFNGSSLFMTVSYSRNITLCSSDTTSLFIELWFSPDKGRSWRVIRDRECWGSRDKFVRVAKANPLTTNGVAVYAYAGVQLKTVIGIQNGTDITFGDWSDLDMPHADIGDICFNRDNTPKLVGGDGGLFKPGILSIGWQYTGGGAAGYNALQVTEVIGQKNTTDNKWNLYFSTQDNNINSSLDAGNTWTGVRGAEGFFLNVLPTTNGSQPTHFTGMTCAPCGNFKSEANLTNQDNWANPPNDAGNPFMLDYSNYIQNTRVGNVDSNIYMLSSDYGVSWNNRFGFKESRANFPRSTRGANPTVFIAADNITGSVGGGISRRILKKIVNPLGPVTPIVSTINNFGGLGTMATEFAWYKVFGVNPKNANNLIITDLQDSTVKVTRNGGINWSIDRSLTNLVTDNGRLKFRDGEHCQVSAIEFDAKYPCHTLVGTQQNGIFRTKDWGGTWEKIEGSEKIPYVTSLFFQDNNRVIVSSYGRGLWKLVYTFPTSCPALLPLDTSIRIRIPVVRDLAAGVYIPFSDVNDAQTCRQCRYIIASNGNISNIRLDEKNNLLGYDKNGAFITVYDAENNKVDSSPSFLQNGNQQEFKNATLQDIEKNKEPIKGIVLEDGKVKAIVISDVDFEPARYKRFFDANPQISLENLSGKFYFANMGYRLNGRFWEPSLPVEISIDGTLYKIVQPDNKGSFSLDIGLRFDEGGHTIDARQKNQNKPAYAVATWNVPRIESAELNK